PETAQSRLGEVKGKIESLQDEVPADIEEIKGKLSAEELKKLADPYVEKATELYNSLAERGEATLERLRKKPVVQENLSRVEKVYNEAVDLTEDALGVVSSQTRLVGERAAKLAGRVSDEVADAAVAIEGAGAELTEKAGKLAGRVSEEVEDAAIAIDEAGSDLKEQADEVAKEIDGAAGEVEAKARTAKASPAKKVAAAKEESVPAVKKAPAKKSPAKKAPAKKATTN
ncbi:heparin-binding hemagglutinin, partial [Gordonia paraffinivorans]|uniref:heparin-binding hemagglutinin n=1 Tax=Gordonia paraffinivorans TaxID=175628 RepID=UPI00242D0C4F